MDEITVNVKELGACREILFNGEVAMWTRKARWWERGPWRLWNRLYNWWRTHGRA